MENKQQNMPEAVASITLNVITPGDFPALLTYRAETFGKLLNDMDSVYGNLQTRGYKPQVKQSGFTRKEPEYVEGRMCPKCSSKLVYGTKQDGEKFIKCSTNKYDFKTKTATGCTFVEFK